MIELSHLRKTYRMGQELVIALDDISLSIDDGELLAIMGPSGSGKSTLMHILGLLDVPDSGSYRLHGREVAALTEDELAILRRREIGFVFQQFHLLSRTTAVENVALPLRYSERSMDLARAEKCLTAVGLGGRLDHHPNQLSGGQQQRVAIARSLINDTRILLADEPTGNLDSQSESEIMGILTALNAKGLTVIIVTHEEEIARYARRVLRLSDGRILSDERVGPAAAKKAARQPEPPPMQAPPGVRAILGEIAISFREAGKALAANKVRSGLSLLGILIGVAAVVAMLALGRGARSALEKQISSMGSNRLSLEPGARQVGGVSLDVGVVTRLTVEDGEAIWREFPQVTRVAPECDGKGQITYADRNWSTKIRATTPDFVLIHDMVPPIGRFFDEEENAKRLRVAVLGMTVVNQLFGDADPIGEYIKINKIPFQVLGILPIKGDNGTQDRDDIVMVPLLTGMRRLLAKDYVDEINVEVADPAEIKSVQEGLASLMIRRHRVPASQTEPFRVRDFAEMKNALMESNRTMTNLIACVALISLLVGGVGIMNIMLVSVTERTKEIGLRKAVGARQRDILAQFLVEAVTISLVGGATGVALGCGASFALAQFAGWPTVLSFDAVWLALFFSTAIGIVFGLWPARKASRLTPITALRQD